MSSCPRGAYDLSEITVTTMILELKEKQVDKQGVSQGNPDIGFKVAPKEITIISER
jgi:hypothetical protein